MQPLAWNGTSRLRRQFVPRGAKAHHARGAVTVDKTAGPAPPVMGWPSDAMGRTPRPSQKPSEALRQTLRSPPKLPEALRSSQKSVRWKLRLTSPGCGIVVLPRVRKVIAPVGPDGGAGGSGLEGELPLAICGRMLPLVSPPVPRSPPNFATNWRLGGGGS